MCARTAQGVGNKRMDVDLTTSDYIEADSEGSRCKDVAVDVDDKGCKDKNGGKMRRSVEERAEQGPQEKGGERRRERRKEESMFAK